jgi:hypothetical protein
VIDEKLLAIAPKMPKVNLYRYSGEFYAESFRIIPSYAAELNVGI